MIEKCSEYNQPLYTTFTDYEKAFDSVDTSAVMQALQNQGVDKHYVRLPADIYNGSTATIVVHNESSKIPIRKGKLEEKLMGRWRPESIEQIAKHD